MKHDYNPNHTHKYTNDYIYTLNKLYQPSFIQILKFQFLNTLNVNIYTLVLNPIISFLMSFKGILRTWEKSINVHV